MSSPEYVPDDQRRLRLVECAACEQSNAAMLLMGEDIEGLQRDLKSKNRMIGKLKAELDDERRERPFHVEAQKIYEFWKERLSPNARSFGKDRLHAVVGRLNDMEKVEGQKNRVQAYTPRYICEAIVGCEKRGKPYDLKWICKDSGSLEYCHDLYAGWVRDGRP